MITVIVCLQDISLMECVNTYIEQDKMFQLVEQTDTGNVAIQAIIGVMPSLVICEDVKSASAIEIMDATARRAPNTYFIVCNVKQEADSLMKLLHAGMSDAIPAGWSEDTVWNALDRFRIHHEAMENYRKEASDRSLRKVLDKKFFEDTIVTDNGVAILRDLHAINSEYQIAFTPGWYHALYIFLDPKPNVSIHADTILPMLQVEEYVHDFFAQYCETMVCYLQEDSVSLILNGPDPIENIRLICRKFLSECSKRFLWLTGPNTLTIGIGLGTNNSEMLPMEIQSSKYASWMRLSEGKGRVLEYVNYEDSYHEKEAYIENSDKKALEDAVKNMDVELCKEIVLRCLNSSSNAAAKISAALTINDTLIQAFNQHGKNTIIENSKYLHQARNMPPMVETISSLDKMKTALLLWIDQCFLAIRSENDDSEEQDIRAAKRYIQEHYHQQLKLDDIAVEVNLTPTYFCAKFKQVTDMTFVEYLTNYRVEQAKNLLRDTNLKIGQVAEQVGFQDARHFSRVFRKKTGMLPTVFRHSMR